MSWFKKTPEETRPEPEIKYRVVQRGDEYYPQYWKNYWKNYIDVAEYDKAYYSSQSYVDPDLYIMFYNSLEKAKEHIQKAIHSKTVTIHDYP